MPAQPQLLAQDCTIINLMRADATHLYWACNIGVTGMLVRRMPLEGGPIETVYTGSGRTGGLAIDGGFVYLTDSRGSVGNDLVVRVPVTGGPPVTLVATFYAGALDVADGTVFYTDAPDWTSRMMRISVDGGTPHFVVRTHADARPFALIADGGTVFYIDDYSIMKVDVQTKQISEVVTNMLPVDIALDSQSVYFVNCITSACLATNVYRVPRGGGALEALGTSSAAWSKIARIDDVLQWGSHVISLSGAPERTLLDTQSSFVVTATAQAFYFGDRMTGEIYRAAR